MSNSPQENPGTSPLHAAELQDAEARELQRQVLAHVREFGPRKYQAFYKQAVQQKESGVDASTIRTNLLLDLPVQPPAPEGGVHFLSKVHTAKQQAIYHVVRNAVEDALARRPALFREEHASAGR